MSKFNRPDESYYPECIGVFWDVVDYPFPNGVSPALIYHKVKLFVESLHCPAEVTSIMAYVDKEKFSDELIRDYKDAGITIIPRQADEYARYRAMIMDIEWWQVDMFDHPLIGRAVMVISKEIKKESHFFTYFKSIFCVCRPVFFTPDPDDHDPPPRRDDRLEPICFNLPSGPIDQTVTLHRTSHRTRKSLETMSHCLINPDSLDEYTSSSSSVSCTHAVFWDGVDYLLPYDDDDPRNTYNVLKHSLEEEGFLGDFSLIVYVDNEKINDNKLVGAYEDVGVTIIPRQGDEKINDNKLVGAYEDVGVTIIPRQGKYARVHSMLVDIVLWAMENPATYFEPKTLIVFSKNIKQGTDFFNVLEALDKRYYNVLLRHPDFDFNNQAFPHEIRFKYLSNDGLPKLWRSREEAVGFSNGLASLNYQDLSSSAIVIFWNVNGFPTKFSSINTVLAKKGYHGRVIIRPYVEMDSVDDVDVLVDKTSERFECESRIRVRSKGNPYEKVTRILLDILFWAMNKYGDLPQNLMLISKPFEDTTKCDIVFQALERRGFHVIFKPSDKVPLIDDYTIESFESLFETVPDGKELFIPGSRIPTDQSIQLADAPVFLSWVVGNCPPSNPRKIWSIFKSVLEKKGYDTMESQLMVYIDEGISDEMIKVYKKAGVCLFLIPKEDKCGKVNGMLLDLICKTRIFKGTANFMVISEPFSDPMCDGVVESLKLRGFNVLFEELDYMLTYGSSLWSAKSLLDGSCSAPSGSSS